MPYKSHCSLLSLCAAVLLLSACGGGGNAGSGDSNTSRADRTAPAITATGSTTVNHEQGTDYTDRGATATDAVDGSVPVTTTGSVGADAGTYTLTYTASDSAGNTATATRTVIVADTTAPVINLVGPGSVTHEQGTPFTDPGASATDAVDGSVAVITTGSVDSAVGTYVLTYTATDGAGNTATASRTVIVEAPPPGSDPTDLPVLVSVAVGAAWDRGINAFDAAIGYGECNNDDGAACPSISWQVISDDERGDVLQVSHAAAGDLAGLFIAANIPLDAGLRQGSREVSGQDRASLREQQP